MAEALLRRAASDRFEAYSAGLEPQVVNPLTVRVMDEIGIDLSEHRAKGVNTTSAKSTSATSSPCATRPPTAPPSSASARACIGRSRTPRQQEARRRSDSRSSAG